MSGRKKDSLTLWYNEPAANWNEAFSIGKGHSGVMVFSETHKELLQLNENTLYRGEPSSSLRKYNFWNENVPELGFAHKDYTNKIFNATGNRLI